METEDGNEDVCGACTDIGDLICCESCPAAYHADCAGYGGSAQSRSLRLSSKTRLQRRCMLAVSPQEVPAGDWYCWSCCIQRKRGFPFPTTRVSVTTQQLITQSKRPAQRLICISLQVTLASTALVHTNRCMHVLRCRVVQFRQELGSTVFVGVEGRLDSFYRGTLEHLGSDNCTVLYKESEVS